MKISFVIYKPAKSSMQSGLLNTKKWCLTNSSINESYKSSKFGWDGSTNPEKKIELFFETLDEAKNFAQKRDFLFEVIPPGKRKILKKSYSQNFLKKKDV